MKPCPIVAVVFALLVPACSSSSGSGSTPSLYGTWAYLNAAGTEGEGITINSDGTYVLSLLQITSPASANVQSEQGSFTLSGSTITATPKEATCAKPDPVYTATYSFQGSNLEIAEPSGVIVFQPDNATGSNIAITFGCFSSSGTFTASPLVPVSN
jgi:hypothetical protein